MNKKTKVLMVYSKWQYGGPPVLSNFNSNLNGSFECFMMNHPNYEVENVYIGSGPDEINTTTQLSQVLLSKEYDVAMVSELEDCVMDIEVAKKIGKKLFLFNWDCNVNISSHLETNFRLFIKKPINISFLRTKHSILEISKYCNIFVVDFGYGEMFPNIYSVANPQDERIFRKSDESEKIHEVSFCGSLHMSERTSILSKLINYGVPLRTKGGRWPAENTLSDFEDYAAEFRSTKIALNFAASPYCRYQRKGRVFEAMSCGALCITTYPEIWKSRTGTWFEAGKHFVEFDIHNCVEVVQYYIKNQEERIRIAEEGHKRWKELCSAEKFWNDVMKIAGVS